jgi:hypothetical protein
MKRVISSALLFSIFALPVVGLVGCGEENAVTKETTVTTPTGTTTEKSTDSVKTTEPAAKTNP